MDDAELLSILTDADAGLSPADGYGPAREYIVELLAERDRLWRENMNLDANFAEQRVLALAARDEAEALRVDRDEYEELFDVIRPIMDGTVNALKGDPGELRLHDQSDLAEVAARVVAERDRLLAVERAVREAFVRHDDDHWCIGHAALVGLAEALDALDAWKAET
jgi:hypothetical protein